MIYRLLGGAVLLSVVVFCCSEKGQLVERAALEKRHETIVTFIKSGSCSNDLTCRLVAVGSKACGGPMEYLAFSYEIDTTSLFEMVEAYNAEEREYNQTWGVVSDCSIAIYPDSVNCLNGSCARYYSGSPRTP